SLLLFSGYLCPAEPSAVGHEPLISMRIPNHEVRLVFEKLARSFIERHTGGAIEVQQMLDSLLDGDERTFERHLNRFHVVARASGGPHPPRGEEACFYEEGRLVRK